MRSFGILHWRPLQGCVKNLFHTLYVSHTIVFSRPLVYYIYMNVANFSCVTPSSQVSFHFA